MKRKSSSFAGVNVIVLDACEFFSPVAEGGRGGRPWETATRELAREQQESLSQSFN